MIEAIAKINQNDDRNNLALQSCPSDKAFSGTYLVMNGKHVIPAVKPGKDVE